jgi:hypothetical protein
MITIKCPDCWKTMEVADDFPAKLDDFLGPDKTRKVQLDCGHWFKAERFKQLVKGK